MSHNTAITIGFVAFLAFVGWLMFTFSPWFAFLLLVMAMGGFQTTEEIQRKDEE